MVWYVNYISLNLFFKNSINPHLLILGRIGSLLSYISCFPFLSSFRTFIPLIFLDLCLLSLIFSLSFSLSPPSLSSAPTSFLSPQESRKFSEVLPLQICSCRDPVSHRASGFPLSQWTSQLSPGHSYELPKYIFAHHIVCLQRKKKSRGWGRGELPKAERASGQVDSLGSGTV